MIPYKIKSLMFLEGVVSISLQFLVLRQLMPYAGSSIITTSIVISVFLAALAFGYKDGGDYKGDKLEKFKQNMLLSGLLLGTCLSSTVISLFFMVVNMIFKDLNVFISVGLFSVLVMAPIVYLMAQTVPLLVDMIEKGDVGEKVGNSISINTMGNILGGIITTLILMYFLGISWSIIINGSILIFLYMVSKISISGIIKGVLAILVVFTINGFGKTINHDFSTQYADYKVINTELNKKEVKVLISNRSIASLVYKNGKNADYIENIKEKIKDKKDILVLGAGGFTLSRGKNVDQNFTYVDIDEKIKIFVEEKFINKEIKDEFIASDARSFINQTKRKWDAVVIDVYSNRTSVPSHLLTSEFYKKTKEVLNYKGIIVLNTIISHNFNDRFSQGINNTINDALSPCFIEKVTKDKVANVIYECHPKKEKIIYTDQTNRNSFDQGIFND